MQNHPLAINPSSYPMCDVQLSSKTCRLVDGDLASLILLGLWNDDREDAILHGSLNVVAIDTDRESKRSREFAHAALTDPVLLLRLGRLLLGDLGVFGRSLWSGSVGGIFIFDGGVVIRWSLGLFIGSVSALSTATDDQSLRVCELDVDVFLIDTWKLALQLVCLANLLDVELGSEALHNVAATVVMVLIGCGGASIVGVKVVEETEEWVEGGRVVGDEGSWEESHRACG